MTVLEINNMAVFEKILTQPKKKIIDFYTDWCMPCKKLKPIFSEFSDEFKEIIFIKVNVDEVEEIGIKYFIQSLPTVIILDEKNELISRIVGLQIEKIKTDLESISTIQIHQQ